MANKLTFSKEYADRLLLDYEMKKRIIAMYQKIANDINAQLNSLSSVDTNTAFLQSTFLSDLQNQINNSLIELGSQLQEEIIQNARDISMAVLEENQRWAEQFGLTFSSSMAYVNNSIMASILGGKIYDKLPDGTDWTLSKAIWDMTTEIQNKIMEIIAEGVARNDSVVDIARNIEYFVDPEHRYDYDLSRIYPGASGKVDYNAFRLARTLVSHAYQQAIVKSVAKNPFIWGLRWYTSHDHRVCQICIEYEETDHHGLGIGIFPKDNVPLDHPNGRCTLIPEGISMDEVADHIINWYNGVEDGYKEGIQEYINSL